MNDGFLIGLRNAFLEAVAEWPIFDWPGPPPGLENRPSASKMGEAACARQVWVDIMSRSDPDFDYEMSERTGEGELAPQRGWILEDSVRHWLNAIEGVMAQPWVGEPVVGPEGLFFGHPDGIVAIQTGTTVHKMLLEIKHQNAMAYRRILEAGIREGSPIYYAQVQAYMLATGYKETLLVVLPFDVSGAKGAITMGTHRKSYAGNLDPDFRMVADSSGVNPCIYFEVVPALPAYQKFLVSWAKKMVEAVETKTPPDRGFDQYDRDEGWHCRAEYCAARYACDIIGPCKNPCAHRWCTDEPKQEEEGKYDPKRD